MCPARPSLSRLLVIGAVTVALFLGVFFRVTRIDRKVYWFDEIYTFLWLSGTDPTIEPPEWLDGHECSAAALRSCQEISPERGLEEMLATLAKNDSQMTPGYFTLAWLWGRCWGGTALPARTLSVLFGLLLLPGTFWLCVEAFGNRRAAWLGTLLVAASPLQFLYAQEARPYSLWALGIVLATAALLRAVRKGTWCAWLVYGLLSLLGLYTHFLHILVMVAHGIWIAAKAIVLERRGERSGRVLIVRFLLAGVPAVAFFVPWMWLIYRQWDVVARMTKWLLDAPPSYRDAWRFAFRCEFIDGLFSRYEPWGPFLCTVQSILFGIGALWFLVRCPRRQTWLLALLLVVTPFVPLAGTDLLTGGLRSTQPRYLFPCHFGITLASVLVLMAFLESPNRAARWAGHAAAGFLIAIGLASTALAWRADAWWTKGTGWENDLAAIRSINESERPLILSAPITYDLMGHTIAFGYRLDPRVRFRMITEPEQFDVPAEFTDVYFVNVTDEFRQRAGPGLRLQRLSNRIYRWESE